MVKVIWQQAASLLRIDGILYTLQWAAPSPSEMLLFMDDLDPYLNMVHWVHLIPQPKWHLDRFSCFAGFTTVTDRPRYSVCNNKPHLHTQYCDAAQ